MKTTDPDVGPAHPIQLTIGDQEPATIGVIADDLTPDQAMHALIDLLRGTADALHLAWHLEHDQADQEGPTS